MPKATDRSIFAPARKSDPAIKQRRAGFFVLNDIDPRTIQEAPVEVFKIGKGRARVNYVSVFIRSDAKPNWAWTVPDGYLCGHSTDDNPHEASRWESIEVPWREVKA